MVRGWTEAPVDSSSGHLRTMFAAHYRHCGGAQGGHYPAWSRRIACRRAPVQALAAGLGMRLPGAEWGMESAGYLRRYGAIRGDHCQSLKVMTAFHPELVQELAADSETGWTEARLKARVADYHDAAQDDHHPALNWVMIAFDRALAQASGLESHLRDAKLGAHPAEPPEAWLPASELILPVIELRTATCHLLPSLRECGCRY